MGNYDEKKVFSSSSLEVRNFAGASWPAELEFAPDFGCLHWEAKEQPP